MTNDAWNAVQYDLFKKERSQPFFDLLALVEKRSPMRVLDLGCGTGELTRHAHDELRANKTLGVDNSAAMLEKSHAYANENVSFQNADIASFVPDTRYELVLSNAALQWLPDHTSVIPRVASFVEDDGQLAIQIPANYDHPSHLVAERVASEAPFRDLLRKREARGVLAPEAYARMLYELGAKKQTVRMQIYGHLLPTRASVVEWVKGTLLTSFRNELDDDAYARFLARYTELLLPELGARDPYFYPFKRILMWASF